MADYKIQLGVQLNTKGLSGEIKSLGSKTKSKVELGVKLNTKGISNQIKAINSKTPVKIDLKLTTKNAQSQINNIKRQIEQLGKIKIDLGSNRVNAVNNGKVSSNQNVTQDTVNKLKKSYKELLTMAKQISNLEFKIDGLEIAGGHKNQIETLKNQLKLLRSEYDKLVDSFNNGGGINSNIFDVGDFQKLNNAIGESEAKIAELKAKLADDIKVKINTDVANDLSKVHSDFDKLSNKSTELKQKLDLLDSIKIDLDTAAANNDIDGLIEANTRYERVLKDVKTQIDINARAERDAFNADILNNKKVGLMADMKKWLKDNSAAADQFGDRLKELQVQLSKCTTEADFKKVQSGFNSIKKEAKEAGVATQTLGHKLKDQISKYSTYLSVASVFMYVTQAMKDMFNQVVAIDSAMTELKKVTDETDASYDKFLSNAASRAKEIRTTIDGLVSSTADFARLGYGFEDAQGLAEVANIYAVVGDEVEGVEGATESLISTMAAFKDEMNGLSNTDFAMSIIDKFNEIGNKFAISSGGIGEALKRSASSLDAANNSIDESIALITAANTVVQDPDRVGNAFKTISMRIRGAKTELEEAGESTDGMVESTAKLRQEVLALSGVDIMKNADEFKSTYDIMDELATKWKDLTDIQQASIIELMAGKHQGNVFASLMQNFDVAREALEVSADSAGSAMQEHAKWSESLEARLLKLKATWQSLSQSFMKSDFLKAGLDIIVKFVDVIDTLIDKLGVLPTLLIGFGIGKFVFNLATMSGAMTGFKDILDVLIMTFPKIAGVASTFFTTLTAGGITLASVKAAFSGLWTVIAAHPILATVAALGIAFVAYDKFTESASELADRIEGVTSKYREQHDALMKVKGDYDTSNEDSMISKYGELSKGVNSLGENISLTADEYAEYQSIVETIAGQMPSLVTGYNSQGDAILSCAGNVDKLAESYRNLIKEQNGEVLKTGEDIFKDFNNDMDKAITDQGIKGLAKDSFTGTAVSHLEALEELFKSEDIEAAVESLSSSDISRISKLLEDSGLERDVLGSGKKGFETQKEFIIRAVKKNVSEVKSALTDAFNDVNAHVEDLSAYTESYFSTAFLGGDEGLGVGDYSGLSDKMQNIISQVTSGFDASFYEQFNNVEELEKYFNNMLSAFDNLGSGEKTKLEAAFDLQTQFNGGKVSYGEYVNGIKDAEKIIDSLGLDEEVASQLKLSLNTDEVKKEYDTLTNRLVEISTKDLKELGNFSGMSDAIKMATEDAKEFLDSLTASEYAVAVELIANGEIDLSDFNIDSLREYIEEQAKLNEAMSFTISMDAEVSGVEAFNTAMAESVSATGLSSTSIGALKSRYAELEEQGYDLSSMFEETSNGIRLNRNAVDELERAYASNKLSETEGHLTTLKGRYDELTEEIKNCTDAGERANLYSEQQEVAQKINDLSTLASQYEGLTSAYNAWQNAESAGNERDMYENIITGFETVKEELSRGWADDGTIKFLELMTGKTDLVGKSAKELKQIYKDLDKEIKNTGYSVKDFFTVDDDGNSTSKGVYNFLKAVETLEKDKKFKDKDGINKLVQRDKDGNIISFDFQVAGGDKAIADALGISEELVQIMKRAADDAGFVVTIDGKWTQLADLKTSAEEASNALNKLHETSNGKFGTDHKFNFGASSLEDLNTELEKANEVLDKFRNKDGTINMKMEGAEEALEVASYFTATIDKLTEPKYMQLETSQVEENLQTPLEKMQKFEQLSKEKHQLTLTGDTKELERVEGEMDEIAKYLDELDEETQIKLGIDGLTQEEIKSKLEKGEIEIPATVDIQMEMSDDIKDMRLLMMNELGLASDNEVKLKIGYEIDDSLVDKLEDKEQKVVLEYIEKNEDAWDKLSEEDKKIFIELVASGVDLDTLTDDETKEVIIDFVTKNKDEFDKLTDEEKEVVVDLVTDDSALKALEEHGVEIEAFCNIFGVEKVDDLKKKLDSLTDEQILVLAEVLGRIDVEKLKTAVNNLDDKTVQAIAEALGKGDVEGLKTTISGLDGKTVQAIAEALGYKDVNELIGAIDNLDPKTVEAIAKALGIKDVDSLKAAIDRLKDKDVDAVANVSGKKDVDNLKSSIDKLKGKTITVWASIKKKASSLWDKLTGGGGVDGTAHANGTAFADGTTKKSGRAFKQGSWGTKDSGVALGGELAPELLVRNGRWHLIGEKGAEFFGYKKGDIIFNGDQTREIFEKGKITHGNSRGKALVGGTAFAKGTVSGLTSKESVTIKADTVNITTKTTTTTKSKSSKNSSSKTSTKSTKSSSKKSSSDDFKETFDWIEIALKRAEEAVDKLDKKASQTWSSWGERNNNVKAGITAVNKEIKLQEKALKEYTKEANSIDLASKWKKKVRNGTIDISTITNEEVAEKIKKYQEYYEKAKECEDKLLELQEERMNKYMELFDNVLSKYDAILERYDHTEAMINEYIAQSEANGEVVSSKYYEALIKNEKEKQAELEKERSELLKKREDYYNEQRKLGKTDKQIKNSEAWMNMSNDIDDVTLSIEQCNTALAQYNQEIRNLEEELRDLEWEAFDRAQDKISDVIEENDFQIELNSKRGNDGNSKGLHAQNYHIYTQQANLYAQEIARLNKEIAECEEVNQELIDRRDELIDKQRDCILAAEDERQAIGDLIREGLEKELDALQERIDKYEEALDKQKDLYDYQKRVKEQTKEIASLEKQMAAYRGDDSEEAKAKIQEIKVSLEEAKDALEETEYERYISEQKRMLDELYDSYESIINDKLDNIDGSINSVIGSIDSNTSSIISAITEAYEKEKEELAQKVEQSDKVADDKLNSDNTNSSVNDKVPEKQPAKEPAKEPSKKEEPKKEEPKKEEKTIKKGGKIKAGKDTKIYASKGAKSGSSQYYKNDPIYKVLEIDGNWLKTRHHKLDSGVTGWFKKGDVKAYKFGARKINADDMAWMDEGYKKEFIVRPSDGAILTPVAKGDSVLNANASSNIWKMANSPTDFIKDNLSLGSANIPNNSNAQSSYTQNLDKVVFNLPNVKNYEELLSEMQKDKNFEKLIHSMSIDRLAGRSALAKNKVIR